MSGQLDRFYRQIPEDAYHPRTNVPIGSVIEAWAESDDAIVDAIRTAQQQIFVESAQGRYLDRLGANVGVTRPSELGIRDEDFRRMVPTLSYVPKQLRKPIWELLRTWYRDEQVIAVTRAGNAGPYGLTSGDTLTCVVDGRRAITFTINESDYRDLDAVTVDELVLAFNRQAYRDGIWAFSKRDVASGNEYLTLATLTPGSLGNISVTGGSAQIVFGFDTSIATTQSADPASPTEWDIEPTTGDTVRITHTGGTDPTLSLVKRGDTVIVDGPMTPDLDEDNTGSFVITDTGTDSLGRQWVEVSNPLGTVQTGLTQLGDASIFFFTPAVKTISNTERPAAVYEIDRGQIEVILPSTPSIIERGLIGATHLNANAQNDVLTAESAAGLTAMIGDRVEPITSIWLSNDITSGASGDYETGESIEQSITGARAKIFGIIRQTLTDTVLLVTDVVGQFSTGQAAGYEIVGLTSLAQRSFDRLITPGRLLQVTSFDVGTETCSVPNHGFVNGDEIIFGTTGALPDGIEPGRRYYVISAGASTFQVALSADGSAIALGPGAGSGSHSVLRLTDALRGTITGMLSPDIKYAWSATGYGDAYLGLLSRISVSGWLPSGPVTAGERYSTGHAIYLTGLTGGNFTAGNTIEGATSTETATILAVMSNDHLGLTILHTDAPSGTFTDGETIIEYDPSPAATGVEAVFDRHVSPSGATGTVRQLVLSRTNSVLVLLEQTVTHLTDGEIFIGDDSGERFVVGRQDSARLILRERVRGTALPGPYVFDEFSSYTLTSQRGSTTEAIEAGTNMNGISAQLSSDFDDGPGWIVIDPGLSTEEGPIRYLSKTDDFIRIDPAWVFRFDHAYGTHFYRASSDQGYRPRQDGYDYSAYLTDVELARTYLQTLISNTVAAGIRVNFLISYPDYPFEI